MEKIELDITPCPKPRMTQRDKWQKRDCVMRYRNFCDRFREQFPHSTIPEEIRIEFDIPMPPSWSKKKMSAMEGKPHQQKPDIDNLCKSVFDALHVDDSHIWKLYAIKRWAMTGKITLFM